MKVPTGLTPQEASSVLDTLSKQVIERVCIVITDQAHQFASHPRAPEGVAGLMGTFSSTLCQRLLAGDWKDVSVEALTEVRKEAQKIEIKRRVSGNIKAHKGGKGA